ncbi:hypothetical protein RvY_04093 [Ramazzottius varieornatus]|uniref:Uncharacterized protein n=1 Tax=Ramazzottius varieornatus TaxID=947166 RepID=A0A1D1UQD8_RAMVA|nr:hypothetical protein RvY_04093 [Ramazzottius varieornatus]
MPELWQNLVDHGQTMAKASLACADLLAVVTAAPEGVV